MLESGSFITPSGEEYQVYKLSTKNVERLDICQKGAEFQIEDDKVVYSRVKKRALYIYGNRDVYDAYMDFLSKCQSIHAKSSRESKWDANTRSFVTIDTAADESQQFYSMVTRENGNVSSTTYHYGSGAIVMSVVSRGYEDTLDPMNFNEYEKIEIDGSVAVKESVPFHSLSVLRARYDLSHIDKTDSVVADDVETATRRLKEWMESGEEIMAVDTETTGTDIDMDGEDKLVGIVLGESETKSTYFPFRHEAFPNLPWTFVHQIMAAIKQNEYRCTGHNIKFERKIFMKEGGWDIRLAYDTFPLSYMINPVNHRGVHTLKNLVYEATGNKYLELTEIFTSENNVRFQVLPKEIVRLYACPDGYNSIVVFKYLRNKLPKEEWALYLKECELTTVKADNEYYGLRVDVDKYLRNAENCDYVIDILLKTFRALTHIDGNINSPAVLSDLIYNRMHCPVLQRTKTGKVSTSGATIRKLANTKAEKKGTLTSDIVDKFGHVVLKADALNSSKYPALLVLDKYREYNKRKTAFYNRFNRTMKTGRIYFWVNQNGAASGRQSSPMHQLPPELKDVIIADTDNHRFVDSDYSQIELRMIAFLAGEKDLIELCSDSDNDIHRVIGSLISGVPMWKIDAATRKKGKCRNFGVVYCISEYGLAGQMFGPGYGPEQVAECKQLIADFFNRFKRINRYIKDNCDFVRKNGYIRTYFNRYRYFPEILDPDTTSKRKAALLRQANNTPVQGTAADLLKIAECNILRYIDNKGWNKIVDGFPLVRMALSIHDETIIMAHRSIPHEEIIEMIRTCMELDLKGAPPFFVCPAFCDTWEGHNDDSLAIPIKLRDKLIDDYHRTGKSVFYSKMHTLDIPQEIKKYVNSARYTETIGEIYEKVKDKITCDDDSIKEAAIKHYIKTNQIRYEETNYLDVLDKYRDDVLNDYMHGLINEFGTDYKVVAEHVRHPSLTHELIDRYKKSIPKGTSHEDSIVLATKMYIEGIQEVDDSDDKKVYDTAMSEEDEKNLFKEVEALSTFDENGDIVYEDESEITEDEDTYSTWDDEDFINAVASGECIYCWRFADAIVADVDGLIPEQIDALLQECYANKDDDGFYRFLLYYQGKLVDSTFRVEDLPIEHINNEIQEMVKQYA